MFLTMYQANALDEIWESYQTTVNSLKAVNYNLSKGNFEILKNTSFISEPKETVQEKIKNSKQNAGDYAILSLWAIFERILFQYVQDEAERMLSDSTMAFTSTVYKKINHECEYWRIDDVLDLFKVLIDVDLIGQAKQVKKYRDWVAHKNLNKRQPQNVPPATAYKVLTEIITELESLASSESI